MGKHYSEQGKYAEAEPLVQRALRVREQTRGTEHSELASLLNDLAILYREQGNYVEAQSLFLRTLHIQEQALGLEHPDVAIQLDGLANLYADQNKYEEAEPLYQRAIHIQEQVVGTEHPDVAASLNNLAELYRQQEKYEKAEPLYQRAIRIWEVKLGPEHPHTAQGLTNLAIIYGIQGKYGEAELLHLRALHIREQSFGPEHPEVAACLANLAALYSAQGKYTMALPLLIHALPIVAQKFGPHHSRMIALQHLYEVIQREMDVGQRQSRKKRGGQRKGTTRKQKWGKTQPLSLKQEHDIQYNLVHKRLSDLVKRASEDIKQMCFSMLHAWEEAVLEESKAGEAFALYGLPPKTGHQLVPENRTHEGRNPQPWTGAGSEQEKGDFYVIDVDQNPFEVALDDDFYSLLLPINMALRQAFDVTQQRFFSKDGEMGSDPIKG